MIDIHDVAIASLAAGDGYFAARGNLHWHAVRRIDVLTFVVLVTATAEWIAPHTDPGFQSSNDRPNRGNRAIPTNHIFINPHLPFQTRGLRLDQSKIGRIIDRQCRSAFAPGSLLLTCVAA